MIRLAIVNLSKRISPDQALKMVKAIGVQVCHDFDPYWNRSEPVMRVCAAGPVPAGHWPIYLMDAPDTEGALGYHAEARNRVFGKVFVDPVMAAGGSILGDPGDLAAPSVSSALSHEVLELLADPWTTFWVDGPGLPQGNQYALEVADPVEADSYFINGVAVSNFVTPQWFDMQTGADDGRYDFLGRLKEPFAMTAGGYLIVRAPAGQEQQVFAADYPEWRRAGKAHPLARTARRARS
jgi:hypothetical protein